MESKILILCINNESYDLLVRLCSAVRDRVTYNFMNREMIQDAGQVIKSIRMMDSKLSEKSFNEVLMK